MYSHLIARGKGVERKDRKILLVHRIGVLGFALMLSYCEYASYGNVHFG
jgi:hypothetical protein